MHSRASGEAPSNQTTVTGDPLASVIELLRPQAVFSKIVTGRGRWSVRYEPYEDPAFCLMLEGACFLDAKGIAPLRLEEGDFALLPATPTFTMSSDRTMRPKRVAPTMVEEVRHGTRTGAPTMRMLGGYFRFDRANAQLLLRFLPRIVLVRRAEVGADRLRRIAELIGDETRARRPARELILERLVEVLLVEALRFRSAAGADTPEAEQGERGLLTGLADPALARALRRIHEDMARRWTVAELARAAGMSRAVFAERFMQRVGVPPMRYLLEWRMAVAKDLLRRERMGVAEVAERVGYGSASAFSTAFARSVGRPPGGFGRAPAGPTCVRTHASV